MPEPSLVRLEMLYRISLSFSSSLDLDTVLNRVMDEVIAATRAERGFLMLLDADGRLAFRSARGMDQRTIDEPEFQVSRGVVERVAREGKPLLTSNAQSDAWLAGRASVISLGLRSILCVPLHVKEATLGVIYVDNRLQAGIFTPDDLDLLAAIAASAAVAIENARLYQVAVEKGRMERELQVARELQSNLMPRQTPVVAGWEVAAIWRPAHEVSGDFYDFIDLGDAAGPRWGIVIADVSDKGMPAALFMALTRSTLRASLTRAVTSAEGIRLANRLICADAADNMFVSLAYLQFAAGSGAITYVNAGHDPPLVLNQATLYGLRRTGPILGFDENTVYHEGQLALQAGETLVMITDGVTDALDQDGESFGRDRLVDVLRAHAQLPAAGILEAIDRALTQHIAGATPFDDVTVVVLQRQPVPLHEADLPKTASASLISAPAPGGES